MMLETFIERAEECQWLARNARSAHDRDLFERMARAWLGDDGEAGKDESFSKATNVRN